MNEKNKLKTGFRLKWLGCAGFEMDFGGFHVVSDPFMTDFKNNPLTWEAVEKCDVIVLTHSHYDHITDIPVLYRKFGAKILCGERTSQPLIEWANLSPMDVLPVCPGLELDFDAVRIKALFGVHTKLAPSYEALMERQAKSQYLLEHPEWTAVSRMGNLEYRNYLFTAPSGLKVLHWGNPLNTFLCNIMRETKADILIQQMTETIPDVELLIRICQEMGTKVLIANHVDFPGNYREKAFRNKEIVEKALPDIRFIIPEYGQWMEL